MKRGQRRNASRRIVYYILIVTVMVLGLTQLGWVYHDSPAYIPVQIEEGDTIWNLAELVTDNQNDVRATVHDIVTRNNLAHNTTLQPGQVLDIPVPPDQDASRIEAALAKR